MQKEKNKERENREAEGDGKFLLGAKKKRNIRVKMKQLINFVNFETWTEIRTVVSNLTRYCL